MQLAAALEEPLEVSSEFRYVHRRSESNFAVTPEEYHFTHLDGHQNSIKFQLTFLQHFEQNALTGRCCHFLSNRVLREQTCN